MQLFIIACVRYNFVSLQIEALPLKVHEIERIVWKQKLEGIRQEHSLSPEQVFVHLPHFFYMYPSTTDNLISQLSQFVCQITVQSRTPTLPSSSLIQLHSIVIEAAATNRVFTVINLR